MTHIRLLICAAVLVSCWACRSQSVEKPTDPRADALAGDGADAMSALLALGEPCAAHHELLQRAGSWDVLYRYRYGPDQPWAEARGTIESEVALGGRYLVERHAFEMDGLRVEGLQLLGFDNSTQEYIALWADSMTTTWVTSRGRRVDSTHIELQGAHPSPGGPRPFRTVIGSPNPDELGADFYDTTPAGEMHMMSLRATRRR